jgi:hypothetical protein
MRTPNLKQIIFGLLCLFVVLYALFQARFLILGPRVNITSPQNGSSLPERAVTLTGTAKNVAYISLNGRQIFTDEEGYWEEKLLVSPGLSIMTVQARDRFGRETEKHIELVLNQ